jgi:integrase
MKILDCMVPHYRAFSEFFLLTGLISSELAGIKKDAISNNELSIRYKVTRIEEGNRLKTEYRTREIPITRKMGEILDTMASKSSGDFVFTLKNGKPFNDVDFRKVWMAASTKAGVEYRKPYTTRHTFVAWARVLGINKGRLVGLMGHGSKKMVDEVYGRYVKRLEQDHDNILGFFGQDFLTA